MVKTNEGGLWSLPHVDELRARGHEVVAVLPPGAGQLRTALTERGVGIVDSLFDFTFGPRLSTLRGLAGLRRQIRAVGPDVIHYHLYASALAARLASLGLRTPRVHMVAGPLYLESRPIRTLERYLARLDTVTIGGSEFTALAYRKLGLSEGRTPAVPYGVDTEHFRPGASARNIRDELAVAPDAFVVAMVALVYAPKKSVHAGRGVKGHEVLLEAWRNFHAQYPTARLLLVGSGFDEAGEQYRRRLAEKYRTSDSRSGVTWVSTTPDVRAYYSAADLSVSPSLSDNHGAALQAGAMGLPSIVSNAGALPETVAAGSGWVVPLDDAAALAEALHTGYAAHQQGRLPAMGLRARELVTQRFNSRSAAHRVVDIIERVAAGAERATVAEGTISLFVEARFGKDSRGAWAAGDNATGPAAWARYAGRGTVRLVARADQRPGTATLTLPGHVQIVAIPFYVGPAGLLRRAIPVAVSITRAVMDAHSIVLRLPGTIGSLAAVVCRFTGRRYAVEVVGDPAEVLRVGALGDRTRWLAPVAEAQMRWIVGGAAASRFVTETTLQQRYPPRPGTISVGITDVQLGTAAFAPRTRAWAPGPFRIMTVGSQETRYKGHDILLRALRLMRDDGMDVVATLVGGGRTHGELVSLALDLDLAEHVTFEGVVTSRSRLLDLLESAALFALPSRTEGLPRALLEAMARALPAVASDVGGIPELLDPSCLVPAGDPDSLASAMASLLNNPDEWEAQAKRNLATANRFRLPVLEEKYSQWLAQIPPADRTAA